MREIRDILSVPDTWFGRNVAYKKQTVRLCSFLSSGALINVYGAETAKPTVCSLAAANLLK